MIFDKIIKDLLNLDFFSEYKFRKRDSSFLLKTKGGKQIIEMDHWIDEATSSLVIYPIYGVRFDILSKWFEKFSVKNLQDQRDGASIDFSGEMLSIQDEFYFNLNGKNMQPILMNYKQKFKSVQNMSFQNIRHLINSIIKQYCQF